MRRSIAISMTVLALLAGCATRRVQPPPVVATLDALAPLMKQGAELRLATDDPSYLPWMVEHACTHPAFEWLAERPADWRTRPPDWPGTRYETKRIAGTPTFLRLRRR